MALQSSRDLFIGSCIHSANADIDKQSEADKMHSKLAGVLFLLSALCGDALAQTSGIPVRWDWLVVSTPDFVGPFRGNLPGFKAPAPKVPLPKILPLAQRGPIFGQASSPGI